MKILDEIIDLLSAEDGSLTAALLKTKVLLHTLGQAELADWVNHELSGYPPESAVPPYRIVGGRAVGNIQNGVMIQGSVPLPTMHLPDKLKKHIDEHEMREGMAVLEDMARAKGTLAMQLTPEFAAYIDKALSGCWVQKAWVEMSPWQLAHGITQVRSRLLDFTLKLRDKIGNVQEAGVKDAVEENDVRAMFHGAVFGDNAVVVIGDHNQTKVSASVRKGDFESLAAFLAKNKVDSDDIADLKQAIAVDGEPTDQSYGTRVKAWFGKMTSKALDGSWAVSVSAGGKLLADALKAYFGW